MGSSTSKNVLDSYTQVVTNIVEKTIQKAYAGTNTFQGIIIEGTGSNVCLSGITMEASSAINMQVFFNTLNTAEQIQDVRAELSQQALAVTSNLNLGNFSSASSIAKSYIKIGERIITNTQNYCKSTAAINQDIYVSGTKGNVTVTDVTLKAVNNIVQNCLAKVINNDKQYQKLVEEIKQSSTSKSEGLSPMFIVLLLLVLIGVPTLGGVFLGSTIFKYLFPIMIITGFVFLILWEFWTSSEIETRVFQNNFDNTCPNAQILDSTVSKITLTIQAMKDALNKNKDAKAFLYETMKITGNDKKSYEWLENPILNLYSKLDDSCINAFKNGKNTANLNILDFIKVSSGTSYENVSNPKDGEGFINTNTSTYWQYNGDNQQWVSHANDPTIQPCPQEEKVRYIKSNPCDDEKGIDTDPPNLIAREIDYNKKRDILNCYKYSPNKERRCDWVSMNTAMGPGAIPNIPASSNVVGWKETTKTAWFLDVGVGFVTIGIIGLLFTKIKSDKTHKDLDNQLSNKTN